VNKCLNCTKFGKLILRKIINIVANRCHILKLKCTKLDFGWGSAPYPAEGGGAYSAPRTSYLDLKGLLLRERREGREGRGREEGKGWHGKVRELK